MNNRNEIYFLSRDDAANRFCLKICDYLPFKLKTLQFKNLRYCQLSKQNKKYILLSDKTGYLIEINMTTIFKKYFEPTSLEKKLFKYPVKDLHNLEHSSKPN